MCLNSLGRSFRECLSFIVRQGSDSMELNDAASSLSRRICQCLFPWGDRDHGGATVAQEAYLCTGTHDFKDPSLQLITKPITIGKNSFIGARAMILPGVRIGGGQCWCNVSCLQRCDCQSNRSGQSG